MSEKFFENHKKSTDDINMTSFHISGTSAIIYLPTEIHHNRTFPYMSFKKSHFWWRHHDVMFFTNYVHVPIALQTQYKKNFEFTTFRLWHMSKVFQLYKKLKIHYKIAWWRHDDVITIFVCNTYLSKDIPSFRRIALAVLKI